MTVSKCFYINCTLDFTSCLIGLKRDFNHNYHQKALQIPINPASTPVSIRVGPSPKSMATASAIRSICAGIVVCYKTLSQYAQHIGHGSSADHGQLCCLLTTVKNSHGGVIFIQRLIHWAYLQYLLSLRDVEKGLHACNLLLCGNLS